MASSIWGLKTNLLAKRGVANLCLSNEDVLSSIGGLPADEEVASFFYK